MIATRAMTAMLAMLAVIPVANGASLRSSVALHGTSVKLSDLFDGLQPGQDCDIGPSPLPGRRLVVPPAQVMAIASQFGVDLQPAAVVRGVSIERPARTLRHDEIVSALRPALLAAGMPADSDVSLGAFADPGLAADNTTSPSVAALDYDPRTGRFSAGLLFTAPDADSQTVRITGRADEMVQSLALLHPVAVGTALGAADVTRMRVRKMLLRGGAVTDPAELAGLVTRLPLPSGAPVTQDELIRPVLVMRGRPVVLRLTSGGLALTAAGTALEAGGIGDRVHVMNSTTRAILVGTVAGGADVAIDPGTAPVFATQPGTGSGQLPRLVADATGATLSPFSNPAQEAR